MSRIVSFAFGLVTYAFFFGTFLYFMGFMNNATFLPRTIVGDPTGPGDVSGWGGVAILINVGMLGIFAIQHTIMARPAFKAWWTKIVPAQLERSIFVLVTTLLVAFMMWQWRPIATEPDAMIWQVQAEWARWLLIAISLLGFGIVLYSTFLISHFDLFGLRQVTLHLQQNQYTDTPFVEPTLYRLVRHPMMLGFIIAFWSTPDMSGGHLLFAAVTTGYIFVGIRFEEHDLAQMLGEDYAAYQKRTPAVIPFPRKRG